MLIRIVKMTFLPDKTDAFKTRFHKIKHKILEFKGCEYLELYQDKNNKCIFFTYSHWQTAKDLNAYRESDFFKEVWAKTKTMFTEKPEAWSVDKIVSLKKPE